MNLNSDIKRKETVRVSKKDLLKLLSENESLAQQVTELQARVTELSEESRMIKLCQITGRDLPKKIALPEPPATDDDGDESFPDFNPKHYLD